MKKRRMLSMMLTLTMLFTLFVPVGIQAEDEELADVPVITVPDVDPNPPADPQAEPDPEPIIETEAVADPEPAAQDEPDAELEPVIDDETEVDPEPVITDEPEVDPEPAIGDEPEVDPEPATDDEPDAEEDVVSVFETDGETLVKYNGSDKAVTVPDGIAVIGTWAFAGNDTLTQVTLPDSVKVIGAYAFADCRNLTSVILGAGTVLEQIDAYAFRGDEKLDAGFAAAVANVAETAFDADVIPAIPADEAAAVDEEEELEPIEELAEIGEEVPVETADAVRDVVITVQPTDKQSNGNQWVYFTVTATDAASYQWQYKRPDGDWANSALTGATTNKLKAWGGGTNLTFTYRCIITGINGSTAISDEVVAYLAGSQDVEITVQPTDKETNGNQWVYFTLTAKNAASYRWQFKRPDGDWIDSTLTGATTNKLKAWGGGTNLTFSYRCVVTGTNGSSVISDVVVAYVPSTQDVEITVQPTDKETNGNQWVYFTLTAKNAASYQWQFKRPDGDWIDSTLTGATTNKLKAWGGGTNLTFSYRCIVAGTNSSSVISDVVVAYLPGAQNVEITVQPTDKETNGKQWVYFTLTAKNAASYQWQFKRPDGDWIDSTLTGATTNKLKAWGGGTNLTFSYRCVVTGANGSTATSDVVRSYIPAPTTITVYGVTYRILEDNTKVAVESIDSSLTQVLILTSVEGKTTESIDEGVIESTSALIFYQIDASSCTVYKYTGSSASLMVPGTVEGFNVTEVGVEAFLDNATLSSISLPNSITAIKARAFKGCSNLSNMTNHD